jgi:DNA-binding transcriptional regulator YiaG
MRHIYAAKEIGDRVRRATVLSDHVISITWSDGVTENKDIAPLLLSHRLYARVRSDAALFQTMRASDDGARLLWEDGSSLSAKAVAKLPRAQMDATEFRSIMADLNLTSEGLGSLLGLSRRAVTNYRSGEAIPRVVALAVHYIHDRWEA